MKKLTMLFALFAAALTAQTLTPSTTLSAAQNGTQNYICLNSTTNIVNQTGIYVNNEYEVVLLSNSATIPAGPTCAIPVSRGNRTGVGAITTHLSGEVAWIAYTPSASSVPGTNGFTYDTSIKLTGTCTRSAQVYLPIILIDLGQKRDCATVGTATGMWVDYAPGEGRDMPSPTPLQLEGTNGALSVSSGSYVITKAGVLALTLAAPTATYQDGMIITVRSATANAHTITATSLLYNGASGVPYTTATFAAYAGAYIQLQAYQGVWYVIGTLNVTLS